MILAMGYSDFVTMVKNGVSIVMHAFSAIDGNWLFLGLIVLVVAFSVISAVIGFLKG